MKRISQIFFAFVFYAQVCFAQTATAPSVGDGSIDTPYQISTWQNLYWISQNSSEWGKYFEQTADIDFTSVDPAMNTWDGGAGWTPIGNSSVNFTGSYHGQDHFIKGLYLNRPSTDYVGLFGFTNGATIQHAGFVDGSIHGQSYVGSFAGKCTGSTISNIYNTGTVTGASQVIGGLVGGIWSTTISYSYNTGTITASSGSDWSYLGGVAGQNTYSTISNCYNTGAVTSGYAPVGGLVGYNNTDGGSVIYSYSSGAVTGYTGTIGGLYRLGGLIGDCCSGSVANSYWDTEASGAASNPSGTGTGLTTAQMKTQSSFSGWDFSSIWAINPSVNNGYPYLQWAVGIDQSLPVELSMFLTKSFGNAVFLWWETATETNNYGFEVERRLGENLFLQVNGSFEWQNVGFTEGSGTTNTPKEYSFTERNLKSGKYYYRLKQIDRDGKFSYSQEATVIVGFVPQEFMFFQNYPNPFNPTTTISYTLAKVQNLDKIPITIKIYDVIGQEVITLVNEVKEAGTYSTLFDASKLTGGVYFAQLSSNGRSQIRKIVLVK
ncbi:MAG: GLUG motif-containing protein [Bacteroidota bacterium]